MIRYAERMGGRGRKEGRFDKRLEVDVVESKEIRCDSRWLIGSLNTVRRGRVTGMSVAITTETEVGNERAVYFVPCARYGCLPV